MFVTVGKCLTCKMVRSFLLLTVAIFGSSEVVSGRGIDEARQKPVDAVLVLDRSVDVSAETCAAQINIFHKIIKDQQSASAFAVILFGKTIEQKSSWMGKEGAIDEVGTISCSESESLGERNTGVMLRYAEKVLEGKDTGGQPRTKMLLVLVNGPSNAYQTSESMKQIKEITYGLSLSKTKFQELYMLGTTENHVFWMELDSDGEEKLLTLLRLDSNRICQIDKYYDKDFLECEDCTNFCIPLGNPICLDFCPYYNRTKPPPFEEEAPKSTDGKTALLYILVTLLIIVVGVGFVCFIRCYCKRIRARNRNMENHDTAGSQRQEVNQEHDTGPHMQEANRGTRATPADDEEVERFLGEPIGSSIPTAPIVISVGHC